MSNSLLWRSRGVLGASHSLRRVHGLLPSHALRATSPGSTRALGFGTGYSFGADFYPIWFTAREGLLHHRDPYSPEMTREIQIGLFGRPLDAQNPAAPIDYRTFAYPAFADSLLWPSAILPFSVVRTVLALILGRGDGAQHCAVA